MTIERTERAELLRRARASIEAGLETGRLAAAPPTSTPALNDQRATFVTLRTGEALRGCCGSIEPRCSLAEDVWRNAWASAFADPRFPPLSRDEYAALHVHISVLSPLERMTVVAESDLLAQLHPGEDGLLLELGDARATFLPAVWETLPDKTDFLRNLKLKAGWPVTFWSSQIGVYRYRTESFGDE